MKKRNMKKCLMKINHVWYFTFTLYIFNSQALWRSHKFLSVINHWCILLWCEGTKREGFWEIKAVKNWNDSNRAIINQNKSFNDVVIFFFWSMPHLLFKLPPVHRVWYAEQRSEIKNVLPASDVDNGKFKAVWMKSDERIWCKISV